ncbi:MAG: phosphotransferase [Proteobacteria bacterium]|nr:phosphotransferase [Pseudomonadota bacterium]
MKNHTIVPLSSPPWLQARVAQALALPPASFTLSALAGDAGTRRYYRVSGGQQNYIAAVDTAQQQQQRFVELQAHFIAAGVRVPTIVAQSEQFLLLEDFGDSTYLAHLPADADALYTAAIAALIRIQSAPALSAALTPYHAALLNEEMNLFSTWYCPQYGQGALSLASQAVLQQIQQWLSTQLAATAAVPVHRDYHARNLMVLPANDTENNAPGILDFQDAVRGCALYDVVSLLRDAYIEWSEAQQQQWLRLYWQQARAAGIALPDSFEHCWQLYNIVGAQRSLKVLGIFVRLARRDNKLQYLENLPLVYQHLRAACAAVPALAPLATLLADVPPQ